MACELKPRACRRYHIAGHLEDATADGDDFEARCPVCGHSTFRVSEPRVRKYRHVWTCACKSCGCTAGAIRVALLRLGILGWCLGVYDGPVQRDVAPEVARRVDLALRDIWATPHLKPADMRLILAEAQGRKIPLDNYTEFVKFAKNIGIGHQQAYEAARRWIGRPSDCRPQTRGAGSDTSRSTEASEDVKPLRSGRRKPTVSVEPAYGNRTDGQGDAATETVERTVNDKPDTPIKPAA